MSTVTEDDIELKDMVTQLLDSNGVLNKLKAQLRAHVYTALESGRVNPKSNLLNPALKEFLNSTSGRLVLCLVREFLEFFQLDFTLAVFDPEAGVGGKDVLRHRSRNKLIDTLGLTELVDPKAPLISEIMRLSKVSVLKSESPTPTDISEVGEDDHSLNQPSLIHDQQQSDNSNDIKMPEYGDYKSWMNENEESLTPDLSLNLQPLNPSLNRPADSPPPSPKSKKILSSLSLDSKELSINLDDDGLDLENHRKINFRAEKDVEIKADKLGASLESRLKVSFDESGKDDLKESPSIKPLSLLGDLPALGGSLESSMLGNLPPLGGSGSIPRGDLPPLIAGLRKELPSQSRGKDLSPLFSIPKESHTNKVNLEKTFTKISEEKESEKQNEYSVSEDIAEDLDSFSSQSNADQCTRDEHVVNSDSSLKADHVESL